MIYPKSQIYEDLRTETQQKQNFNQDNHTSILFILPIQL